MKDRDIDFDTAIGLLDEGLLDLIKGANEIREHYKGKIVDLCSIINAKSGRCKEDCIFCSQSIHYKTNIDVYPFVGVEKVLKAARNAKDMGANRFGVVISGKGIGGTKELRSICETISKLKEIDIFRCASLGILTLDIAHALKDAGLEGYHHNLETSKSYFRNICTTHRFEERRKTIEIAKEVGFRVCSGGIFGLGETMEQRIELAFILKELDVDSIPINILNPIQGTPVESQPPIPPLEILRIIAIYRFILPKKDIKVCGGREYALRDLQALMYLAGANGTLIGNYLTTPGRPPKEDIQMIKDLGLVPKRSCK
ncbi:MAG: biotin synthase BioB [bacterium]|nr:biotin synthase BioB [bacterium]